MKGSSKNYKKGKQPKAEKSQLEKMIGKQIQVITGDGRTFLGTLNGLDQTMNCVIDHCKERVYSKDRGVEEINLGLYMIRGELVTVIGELDLEAEKNIDLGGIIGEQLPPIKNY